ncbi:MAG: aminopeptidase P family protein [Gemmatimonadaceae bacterium]
MSSRLLGLALALSAAPLTAQIPAAEYAQRRAALAAKLDDGVLVSRGAAEPVLDYSAFFQSPNFLYLTGYREPAASLVMTKRGSDVRWTLFVQKKVPAVEVWSGVRNGPAQALQLTGIPTRHNDDFEATLDSLLRPNPKVYVVADIAEGGDTLNKDDEFVRQLRAKHSGVKITEANTLLQQARAVKSPAELELLRKAIAISADAHKEAIRAIEPGMNEFEIQALVEYTFRRNGADRPGYASIVGSGANSTTLHYNRDDRFMQAGEMMVMDVGALYRGYSADITRSFPIGGTFTAEQRAVYQIVRDAQAAAERNARPGSQWKVASDSARAVIAAGLTRLGLIESAESTYDCGSDGQPRQCPQVGLYYMHGLGHGIGLEVHDPDQYYFTGIIGVGSAFSIEPGIYVRGNLLEVIPDSPRNRAVKQKIGSTVARYANVGVRIEDNYLVTEQGLEWASCGLPREIGEIEALMKEPSRGPAARDAAKIEWYRAPDGSKEGATSAAVVPANGCGPRM